MASPSASRIVGRYALFDVIASGGMASVHLGRLMGPVGFSRTVAIKRLHESYARDPEFVAMFLDEARLVARIRHPNVVPTLDVVALEHELLLVMEYVLGVPLGVLANRSKQQGQLLPVAIGVDILVNVLNGLHAAHEASDEEGRPLNIVHRDVSPQNILVGADGIARVLDFGVAKAVGRMHQTRDGQLKGKLRYMPPEYLLGQGVGRVADVYSAAVVLWEALTGDRLFGADDEARVMYQVLEGKISPPSRYRREVSPKLDAVVMRGLSKEPAARFQSAKDFAAALEEIVPPVRRRKVSDWVAEVAGDYMVQRQESVARVESSSAPERPQSRPPPIPLQIAEEERSSESGATLRTASAVSHTPRGSRRASPSTRGRSVATALAMLTILVTTIWVLFGGAGLPMAPQVAQAGTFAKFRGNETDSVAEGMFAWRSEVESVLQAPGEAWLPSPPPEDAVEKAPRRRVAPRRAPRKVKKAEPIYSRD